MGAQQIGFLGAGRRLVRHQPTEHVGKVQGEEGDENKEEEEEEMLKCPGCNRKNKLEYKFCMECGEGLSRAVPTEAFPDETEKEDEVEDFECKPCGEDMRDEGEEGREPRIVRDVIRVSKKERGAAPVDAISSATSAMM